MTINWQKSESSEKPLEVDYESSPTTVFIRRKIRKREDDFYEFEEAKLTPAEYSVFAAEQNREDSLAIMEALSALYMKIGG